MRRDARPGGEREGDREEEEGGKNDRTAMKLQARTTTNGSDLPLHKRLFFFAKIDGEQAADRVKSLTKLPGLPDLRKAYDDVMNPEFKPDRRRLSSVEDFFRYTEEEGE